MTHFLTEIIEFISKFPLSLIQSAEFALCYDDRKHKQVEEFVFQNNIKHCDDKKDTSKSNMIKMITSYIKNQFEQGYSPSFSIIMKEPIVNRKGMIIEQGFQTQDENGIIFEYSIPGNSNKQYRNSCSDIEKFIDVVASNFSISEVMKVFGLDNSFYELQEDKEVLDKFYETHIKPFESIGKKKKKKTKNNPFVIQYNKILTNYEQQLKTLIFNEYKQILPVHIVDIKQSMIFGCPQSTDIDCASILEKNIYEQYIRGEIVLDISNVLFELYTIGYDIMNRELDFSYIELEVDSYSNVRVRCCTKGVNTFNTIMLRETFGNHRQILENCPITVDSIEFGDLIRPMISYFCKDVESEIIAILNINIVGKRWEEYRKLKRKSFGTIELFNNLISFITDTDCDRILNALSNDVKKSIMMKMMQILIADYVSVIPKGQICAMFQKTKMAQLFSRLYYEKEGIIVNPDELIHWLMRGKQGIPLTMDTFKTLIRLIVKSYNNSQLQFERIELKYPDINQSCFDISSKLDCKFVESTLQYSKKIPPNIAEYITSAEITTLFDEELGDSKSVFETYNSSLINKLVPLVMFHIHSFSAELYEAMTLYKSGTHSIKPILTDNFDDDIKTVYHLLFGQICEEVFTKILKMSISTQQGKFYETIYTLISNYDCIKDIIDIHVLDIVMVCNDVTGNAPDGVLYVKFNDNNDEEQEMLFVIECKSKEEKYKDFDQNETENKRSLDLAKLQTVRFCNIVAQVGIQCGKILVIVIPDATELTFLTSIM